MQPDAGAAIPDDALVVRGGQNTPEQARKGYRKHPSGVQGVSVHTAPGASIAELAVGIPNGQIGITTVGQVRAEGGAVIRTSGRSPHHATLTGLTPDQISDLLTPTVPNPTLGMS